MVTAPTLIRPNQVVTVAVTMVQLDFSSVTVTASIHRRDDLICQGSHRFTTPGINLINMKVYNKMYKHFIRVELVTSVNDLLSGFLFCQDLFAVMVKLSVWILIFLPVIV